MENVTETFDAQVEIVAADLDVEIEVENIETSFSFGENRV